MGKRGENRYAVFTLEVRRGVCRPLLAEFEKNMIFGLIQTRLVLGEINQPRRRAVGVWLFW
jgi:hypothetical protein